MRFRIEEDLNRMDVKAIHAYLSKSYWAANIPLQTVEKSLRNSMCFAVFVDDHQIGFARVVTDKATFAYLADVYILERMRSKGLGKKLIDHVLKHPQLQGLRRIMLATRDAQALYARFGFKEIPKKPSLMQLLHPNVYDS